MKLLTDPKGRYDVATLLRLSHVDCMVRVQRMLLVFLAVYGWSAVLILIGARLCPQDPSQGLRRVNALRLTLRTQPRSIMRIADGWLRAVDIEAT